MSTFEVPIVRVTEVKDHPNADRLSLIYFRQFVTISAKLEDGSHRYQPGDLVVYVPENALVPEFLLKRGFWNHEKNKGMLSGTAGNRVKPVKLRGILSEGIMFAVEKIRDYDHILDGPNDKVMFVFEGDNVADWLGITKYEPEIPARMAGELTNILGYTVKFDVENMKKFPNILVEGEEVVYTEKLHGSNCQIVISPDVMSEDVFCGGHAAVCSKGLGATGLAFKDNVANSGNLFVRAAKKVMPAIEAMVEYAKVHGIQINVFGEVFGSGVQDLTYGQKDISIRVFDVRFKHQSGKLQGAEFWLSWDFLVDFCEMFKLEMVPIVEIGPFSLDRAKELSEGNTLIEGANQIREGVVVKPGIERTDDSIGRVFLKYVGESYLTRKGNTTEYN